MAQEKTHELTAEDLRKVFNGDADWLGSSTDKEQYIKQIIAALEIVKIMDRVRFRNITLKEIDQALHVQEKLKKYVKGCHDMGNHNIADDIAHEVLMDVD